MPKPRAKRFGQTSTSETSPSVDTESHNFRPSFFARASSALRTPSGGDDSSQGSQSSRKKSPSPIPDPSRQGDTTNKRSGFRVLVPKFLRRQSSGDISAQPAVVGGSGTFSPSTVGPDVARIGEAESIAATSAPPQQVVEGDASSEEMLGGLDAPEVNIVSASDEDLVHDVGQLELSPLDRAADEMYLRSIPHFNIETNNMNGTRDISMGNNGESTEVVIRLTASERDVLRRVSGPDEAVTIRDEQAIWESRDAARAFLDHLQRTMDGWRTPSQPLGADTDTETILRRGSRLLVKISKHIKALPSALFLTGVVNTNNHAVSGGAYADIYVASYKGKPVALKRLRVFTYDANYIPLTANFIREALTWRQLEHDNVLPFLGVDVQTFGNMATMVSPWMQLGNSITYLGATVPKSAELIERLSCEVIDGLVYLHGRSVVHGDLRGVNILIDERKHARLADFGLSRVSSVTTTQVASTQRATTRWTAPELMDPTNTEDAILPTKASDIYSFACVVLELHTLRHPFLDVRAEVTVAMRIMGGDHPPRPASNVCIVDIPDARWSFMQQCWNRDPEERIGTAALRQKFIATNIALSTPSGGHIHPRSNSIESTQFDQDGNSVADLLVAPGRTPR